MWILSLCSCILKYDLSPLCLLYCTPAAIPTRTDYCQLITKYKMSGPSAGFGLNKLLIGSEMLWVHGPIVYIDDNK